MPVQELSILETGLAASATVKERLPGLMEQNILEHGPMAKRIISDVSPGPMEKVTVEIGLVICPVAKVLSNSKMVGVTEAKSGQVYNTASAKNAKLMDLTTLANSTKAKKKAEAYTYGKMARNTTASGSITSHTV